MTGGPLAALARRADPADPGAQNNLGVVLLARGHRAAAAAAFSRALALDPRMSLARRNLDAADGARWIARRSAELRARLRANGADVDARYALARLLADGGRLDDARRELDALAAQLPNDAGPCVQRGLLEQAAGDLDAAAEWLARAIARDENAALPRAHLGEVLYHRGDPAQALSALDAALALAPDHADAHFIRGFVLGELGRVDEAAAARERAFAINPALGRAHANLAAGDAAGAADADVPNDGDGTARAPTAERPADAHHALGLAFRQKGYFDEALREYRRAVARGDDEPRAARAIAEIQLLAGTPDDALVQWTCLTERAPCDAEAWHGRAVAAHLTGRLDDARRCYERGIAVAPAARPVAARLHNDLAVLDAATGRAEAALTSLATSVAAAPTAIAARLNHAQLLAVAGDAGRAVAEYRSALRVDPVCADAWAGLGSVLAAAGRSREARAALSRALDADPTRADVRYELGFLAVAAGDHTAARRETEHAMASAPLVTRRPLALAIDLGAGAEHARSRMAVSVAADSASSAIAGFDVDAASIDRLLGDVLAPNAATECPAVDRDRRGLVVAEECLRAGLHDRAAAAAHAALARGAPRAACLTLLADVFVAQGYFGEALERYSEARALDPLARGARIGEIRMLRETGRRAAAREAAESLAAAHHDDPEVHALVALVRADAGADDEARAALGRVADGSPSAATWADVAQALRAVGDYAGELTALRRALSSDASRWPLRLAAARALVALGRADDAEAELRAVLDEHPACADGRLALAELRCRADDHASARRLLVNLVADDPLHLDALAALGAVLIDERRLDDARVAIARVLRFDPAHAAALALDGELLAHDGRLADAHARWDRVLRAEPVGDGATRARAARAQWVA